ncbi:MAG: TonB family protein [Sulfuricella denitrificans]|nr:TonB family protein [Sulfuricella denitrificans]
MTEFLFRFRETISAANATALVALLLVLFGPFTMPPNPSALSPAPIEVILATPEIEASPDTPPPQPVAKKDHVMSRKPAQTHLSPLMPEHPLPMPDNTASPALAEPTPLPAPAAAPETILAPQAPPPPRNPAKDVEALYVARVRAHIQSIKHYPTGREASLQRPRGTAVVWFTLRRSGELAEAGVEKPSGSMLLDSAALSTVRRGIYPPFPDNVWTGKTQQRFSVELDFIPYNPS